MMISGAVAGDDLQSVAGSASEALGRPVAIALPSAGARVVWPPDVSTPDSIRDFLAAGTDTSSRPRGVADAVPIVIGQDVVGIVAALGDGALTDDERAWLEAAAAAAAVTALMRESTDGDLEGSRRAILRGFATGRTADVTRLVGQARRLGFDLSSGAVAVCARAADEREPALRAHPEALLASIGAGRLLGLVPLAAESPDDTVRSLAADLEAHSMTVGASAPRRDPAALHEAVREAELLVELARADASLTTQEETYRLLIGVLLRERAELELLRERTIAAISSYDAEHDTELLATLQAFLAHHGSTTDTAEAMSLHRHTVGYRLTRVQEVSGLSPYESDGRERLSLGLKADQILEADKRRAHRE
jgi:DNA-binding PucR family transcriptional regulator